MSRSRFPILPFAGLLLFAALVAPADAPERFNRGSSIPFAGVECRSQKERNLFAKLGSFLFDACFRQDSEKPRSGHSAPPGVIS